MNRVKREPVAIAGAVILAAQALIGWLLSMGIVSLNGEQLASTENLIFVMVELAVLLVPLYLARRKVTPLSDPRDADGDPVQLVAKR